MREPKFRGFSKGTNSWHYGFGWCKIDYTEDFLKESGIEPQAMLYTDSSPIECVLSSMGQYTGLKDKNDREVFEGDVLKIEGSKRKNIVQWDDEEASFVVSYTYANGEIGKLVVADFLSIYNPFEVAGNVYVNIKEEKEIDQ